MAEENRQLSTVNHQPRVALVHDYLNQYGGAERVLEVLHQMYPEAPIFTSVYDREGMRALGFKVEDKDVRTSFMQRIWWLLKLFPRYYFTFLYPVAFRLLDLRGYDLIVSDASYAAKYVRVPKGAVHVCYCHTPPRFLYGYDNNITVERMNVVERWLAWPWRKFLHWLDQRWSKEVTVWIGNSQTIKQRIEETYGVKALSLYPAVDLGRFAPSVKRQAISGQKIEEFFLVVSRLNEYKRVDLIVQAFNELGWPLKVVGRGAQESALRQMAGPKVEILGGLPDEQVTEYYQTCRALVLMAVEDAGITQLEAMACGKPVIALGQGGYLETIIDSQTGVFFPEQSVESLKQALLRFDQMTFDPEVIKARAQEFSPEVFTRKLGEIIEEALSGKRTA